MALLVVGTGRLARAACYSLAALGHRLPPGQRVVVVGRRPGPAEELCHVASARAAVSGTASGTVSGGRGPRFEPVVRDPAGLADLVDGMRPRGVLVCASTQSPWERMGTPSAWTELVRRARFGVTLPFQAELALRVARAAPAGTWVVNTCFPDAVNPLLAELGAPVLCGAGNAGLVAAGLQAALGLPDQVRLRLVAHHLHLYPPGGPDGEALAWLDDEPIDPTPLLAGQRAAAPDELNHVTGHTAALLVSALLTGTAVDTTLPGPLGLPGGYPVTVTAAGGIELRLPAALTREQAVAHNQRWALADGAVVAAGRVTFGEAARVELARTAPELADGFAVADLPAVTERLHQLRDQLRDQPGDR